MRLHAAAGGHEGGPTHLWGWTLRTTMEVLSTALFGTFTTQLPAHPTRACVLDTARETL